MKAIHTFIPSSKGSEFNKNLAYNMVFSVACAKSIYGEIVLYTNEEIAEVVRKIGIPYDEIITDKFTNKYNNLTFSIPKMIVYSLQTEPFVHLDLDTFQYKNYLFPEDVKVFFATKDTTMDTGDTHFPNSMNLFDTYYRGVSRLDIPLPKEFKKYMNFLDIPNMNIFGGEDFNLIKEASKYALNLYEENKAHYDSEYHFACVVEQLYISTAIKMINESHSKNYYLYENIDGFNVIYNEEISEKYNYPIEFYFCDRKKIISNEEHLYQFVNYDFNTTVHLCGYKYNPELQFIFKETAIERFFCEEQFKMINKIFPNQIECDNISKRYYKKLIYNSNKWSKIYSQLI
jgi:hypothetical protein